MNMKRSIVLLVLLVAGCGKGGPVEPHGRTTTVEVPTPVKHGSAVLVTSTSEPPRCTLDGGVTWHEPGLSDVCASLSKIAGNEGAEFVRRYNDLLGSVKSLKEENAKLKTELAKTKNAKPCQMPKGQPPFTLPMNGGVKYPDGFVYICDESGLRVAQDPLKHIEGVGPYSAWQSDAPVCTVHPDEEISGVVGVCDEKRAAEDAKRP